LAVTGFPTSLFLFTQTDYWSMYKHQSVGISVLTDLTLTLTLTPNLNLPDSNQLFSDP